MFIALPSIIQSQRNSPTLMAKQEFSLPKIQQLRGRSQNSIMVSKVKQNTNVNCQSEEDLENKDNLLSLMFDDDCVVDKDTLMDKQMRIKNCDLHIVILKQICNATSHKILLCYDQSKKRYQLWKKYKPQYLNMAVQEKKLMEEMTNYKIQNTKNQELHQLLASQMKIQIVNPLVPQSSNFPNHQLLIYDGGLCNLLNFAQYRLKSRKDPFSEQEANYLFWFLIYTVYQLHKANITHNLICPANIVLEKKRLSEYELRLFNSNPTIFTEVEEVLDDWGKVPDKLNDVFNTIVQIYFLHQDNQIQQLDQYPSLIGIKRYLSRISDNARLVVSQLDKIYPKQYIQATKTISDKEQIVLEFELATWGNYFKRKGKNQFDHQILIDLGLIEIQQRLKLQIILTQELKREQAVQEILVQILNHLVQPYTRDAFMNIFSQIKQAQNSRDYSNMLRSYDTQSKFYEQMGEYQRAMEVLELSEKLLIQVTGESYFQRCLDVYARQALLYFELGQYEKSMEKQKITIEFTVKHKIPLQSYLRKSMVLLQCQILDQKGQYDKAVEVLFNQIFKIEKKEKIQQITDLSDKFKKHKLQKWVIIKRQLCTYYDALSQIYWKRDMFKLSQSYQEKSLTLKIQFLQVENPDVAFSQRLLSKIMKKRNKNPKRYEELDKLSQMSIQSIKTYLYSCVNDVDGLKKNINISQMKTNGQIRKNIDIYDPIYRKTCVFQCFVIIKRICGQESTEYQEECLRMVQVCYELGQLKEAKYYLGLLQEVLEQTIPALSPAMKPIYYEQCQLLYELRDFDQAQMQVEKLISLFEQEEMMGIDYSTALALRAGIYSELEDYEKAILYKEESLMIKKNLYGNDHVEVLTGYKTLLTLKKAKYDKNNK